MKCSLSPGGLLKWALSWSTQTSVIPELQKTCLQLFFKDKVHWVWESQSKFHKHKISLFWTEKSDRKSVV